jgi:hypothetical protein
MRSQSEARLCTKTLAVSKRYSTEQPRSLTRSSHCNKYSQRCEEMGLTSLTKRRERGDLIQMFKFENDIEVINWHNQPLRIPPLYNEYHHYTLYSHKERFYGEVVRNCEPDTVVQARTVNEFKNRLDSYHSLSSTMLSTRCILCA